MLGYADRGRRRSRRTGEEEDARRVWGREEAATTATTTANKGGDVSEDTGISSADSRWQEVSFHYRMGADLKKKTPEFFLPPPSSRFVSSESRPVNHQLRHLQQQLRTAEGAGDGGSSCGRSATVDSFMDEIHSKQSHFFNSLFPSRANRQERTSTVGLKGAACRQ